MTILIHPKPPIHVKNPLSENISLRLRMYKVRLFKYGHLVLRKTVKVELHMRGLSPFLVSDQSRDT